MNNNTGKRISLIIEFAAEALSIVLIFIFADWKLLIILMLWTFGNNLMIERRWKEGIINKIMDRLNRGENK